MRILASALSLGLLAGSAGAVTLTFDGDICNGGTACGSGASIDQSYGDQVGVDVQYDGSNQPGLQSMHWWPSNYSFMTAVAYSVGSGHGAPIVLDALAGYEVTLLGFDLGGYSNANRTTRLRIYEHVTGSDFFPETTGIAISGATPSHFAGPYTSNQGIVIDFGPDAWNVGIDNIEFIVNRIGNVPLPASAPLLAAGLAGLLTLARRRKN